MVSTLKVTIGQLDSLPDDNNRYELIDGELVVSKASGTSHQDALTELLYRLWNWLKGSPVGRVLLTPGLVFDDYNAVIPDLAFVAAGRAHVITERGLIDAPDLIVEVVSPGKANSDRDRQMKRQLYSVRGVREYWVVDPELKAIEVYRLSANVLTLEATLRPPDTLSSPILPGFSCLVSDIFARS